LHRALERWERHYWFAPDRRSQWPDDTEVAIDLRQAGCEELRGGRHVHARPFETDWAVDDRAYNVAFGTYDVASDRVVLRACGPSMG